MLNNVISILTEQTKWIAICSVLALGAYFFPAKAKQKIFRRDIGLDLFYWFGGALLYTPLNAALGAYFVSLGTSESLADLLGTHEWVDLNSTPMALQVLGILFARDIYHYWIHRAFHRDPLWKIHAIHHCSKEVDWLSGVRFHPINLFVASIGNIFVLVAGILLGLGPEPFGIVYIIHTLYSPFVHSNVRLSFGIFSWALVSPIYHHWHHTSYEEGGNKNFAGYFPILDLIFGTYYLPKGVMPTDYGTPHDDIPDSVVAHLKYPFVSKKKAS